MISILATKKWSPGHALKGIKGEALVVSASAQPQQKKQLLFPTLQVKGSSPTANSPAEAMAKVALILVVSAFISAAAALLHELEASAATIPTCNTDQTYQATANGCGLYTLMGCIKGEQYFCI